ncbi:MAG: hypothetical protein NVS1B6_11380 [Steroidobacteraceae bacterium]
MNHEGSGLLLNPKLAGPSPTSSTIAFFKAARVRVPFDPVAGQRDAVRQHLGADPRMELCEFGLSRYGVSLT